MTLEAFRDARQLFTVRRAVTADAALIARLTRACWAGRVAAGSSGHLEDEARALRDLAEGGGFILEREGEAAGSVRWSRGSEAWELMRLGILPAYRGRGLSQWLMDLVETEAQAAGAREIRLAVRTDQPRLVEVYRALGYQIDSSLRYSHANPNSEPPVVMRKRFDV